MKYWRKYKEIKLLTYVQHIVRIPYMSSKKKNIFSKPYCWATNGIFECYILFKHIYNLVVCICISNSVSARYQLTPIRQTRKYKFYFAFTCMPRPLNTEYGRGSSFCSSVRGEPGAHLFWCFLFLVVFLFFIFGLGRPNIYTHLLFFGRGVEVISRRSWRQNDKLLYLEKNKKVCLHSFCCCQLLIRTIISAETRL